MKTATGNKAGFVRRLRLLGKTLADAQTYILADDGERLTFNIDHPDYPHKDKVGHLLKAAVPVKPSGPDRWREAFLYVLSPEYDPATFADYARKLAKGMSGPCHCSTHWAIWWRTHPPTPDQPFGWLWLAKNVIATRVHKPLMGYDQALAYWQGQADAAALRP